MRTTLNIDDQVAEALSELARQRDQTLSGAANEVLQAGLRAIRRRSPTAPYDPPVYDTGRPLLDVSDTAEALELLDRG
jgi:hypothetical protein